MNTETTVTTRTAIRTYSDGSTTRRFLVDDTGAVLAWDSVAGHYTTLHSLTPRQQAAIRRLSRQ